MSLPIEKPQDAKDPTVLLLAQLHKWERRRDRLDEMALDAHRSGWGNVSPINLCVELPQNKRARRAGALMDKAIAHCMSLENQILLLEPTSPQGWAGLALIVWCLSEAGCDEERAPGLYAAQGRVTRYLSRVAKGVAS